jgi:hypothetical protein
MLEMPRPNKRKKQDADGVPVQDVMSQRRKTSKLLEESLKVPKENSSPIDAIVVPDAITSLHERKKRAPEAEAEAATNTAFVLPDVATSLPNPMSSVIAEAATSTASPDVVASASLPPADLDVVDDDNAKNDNFTDTRSNNHPRATNPSTSTSTQGIKLEPVFKTETSHAPAPTNTAASAREIKREPIFKTETAPVNPSIDQAEAPIIHTEPVITNGPHLNRTVTVRRKVAKRTDFLYVAPPPQNIALPLPPSPDAEISDAPILPPCTAAVEGSIRRTTGRQNHLPSFETSEEKLDGDNDDDDDVDDVSAPSLKASWETRISKLADYRKIHGHCNVPRRCSENLQLGTWVGHQRTQYRLLLEGKKSQITLPRVQELESLGFKWKVCFDAWEERLSELADYRKIHGHCNVPKRYSENIQLGTWVGTQRKQYKLHEEGKKSRITLSRIKELENLGFEWRLVSVTTWEARLSELADYRKIHGHCNVPKLYSENIQLGTWVATQRQQYKLHLEGMKSQITIFRIQELEILGFEWSRSSAARKDRLS